MTTPAPPQFFTVRTGADQRQIAWRAVAGRAPTIVWLGGFMSDMRGTKAEALAEWAVAQGRAFLRFDYSCHGESGGDVMAGTISRWTEEAVALIAAQTQGPLLLVGSSMGGWIALRAVSALAAMGRTVEAMVLIAPAPDFTDKLMWPSFSEDVKAEIMSKGHWTRPTPYDDGGYVVTRALIEDGKRCSVLDGELKTGCAVHILQGMRDTDVPHEHALRLVSHLAQDDVTLTLVKDGDHRLSRPEDIALLIRTVAQFSAAR